MDQLWFYLVLAVGGGVTYVGARFYEAREYVDIRRARNATYRDHATARSVVDRAATQHGLDGTDWSERDEGYRKVLYPARCLREPFQVLVGVDTSGRARLELHPEGSFQDQTVVGHVAGVDIPFGYRPFKRLTSDLGAT